MVAARVKAVHRQQCIIHLIVIKTADFFFCLPISPQLSFYVLEGLPRLCSSSLQFHEVLFHRKMYPAHRELVDSPTSRGLRSFGILDPVI